MSAIDPILRDLPSELIGDRILLRPYRAGDGQALFQAIGESREHLRRWMPWADTHQHVDESEVFARRMGAKWLGREDFCCGIWERETGGYLGSSGLHPRDWDVPEFETGYWLRPSAEGHGYVSEAVRLLARLAFETLGANRLFLRCDVQNERSAAVARRLGFVHEGTFRSDSRDPAGSLRDTHYFALTSDDYAKLRDGWWRGAQQ
jgi:RimJ/RimL family protein N-acetyltransferase